MNTHFWTLHFNFRTKQLIKRMLFLLFVYFILRSLFFIFNQAQFSKFSAWEVLKAYALGIRFDASALFLLNLPLILISLLPANILPANIYNRATHWLFLALNIPFILANFADMEYYKFTGSHMTMDVLYLKSEAVAQADQLLIHFWHLFLIFILVVLALHLFSRRLTLENFDPIYWEKHTPVTQRAKVLSVLKSLGLGLAVLLLTVVLSRGGLQKKPLKPTHAYVLGHDQLGSLVLNTTFTMLKSDMGGKLKKVDYFPALADAAQVLPQPHLDGFLAKRKSNVVILILESFATEFWGAANSYKGYTPFLDTLAKKSLFFKNNFANGRRSIEGLPAVLWGMPSLMSTPIANSNYQQNNWQGLGHILKEAGYHTSFFHGAIKGTMYFDAISARGGLQDYYPLERYPDHKRDFDGDWGIFDEPFLQYMVQELNQHPQPFFSLAFTISTHQPYHVPDEYAGKFPKGNLQIHESVGYVDHAVAQFFAAAEKQPWFKDTLFIITGDHTQMSESEFYNQPLGRFMVPLLIYHPSVDLKRDEGQSAPVDESRVTQHADILPTVLDFTGAPPPATGLLLFGRSVFDTKNPGEAILHQNGNFWLVRNDYFMQYTPATNTSLLYDFKNDLEQKRPLTDATFTETHAQFLRSTQAYIQYFQNGLLENKLYGPARQ